MGLSIKEQHERRDEHRKAFRYLIRYLRLNNVYDTEKSDKLNIKVYFEANVKGYNHGKKSYTRLAKYTEDNNNMLPESMIKVKGINKRLQRKKAGTLKAPSNFYNSREWRSLRVKALINNGRKCCLCGRNPKEHGIILHVDHIKPRSKYPELELKLRNLQILCEDCNLGKSNKYEDDWR